MTGTILKRNNDDSIHLISTGKGWILEDTVSGKIIDETSDYTVKDQWIKDYKLNRNVGQFWYKEDKIMNGYERNANSINKVFSSKRNFDDVELQILFDNIVGGQDEMFFDWYSEKYGDLPWDNLKSIPKERIAEYVNENPDVLADMEYEIDLSYDDYASGNTLDKNVNDFLKNSKEIERSFVKNFPYKETRYVYDPNIIDEDTKTVTFEDYGDVDDMNERLGRFRKDVENAGYRLNIRNSKAIKSSVSIDDRLARYISSDSFAERYGYDDYRIDKLVDMGFGYEDIEFKWDSPKIQRALKKIDKAYDESTNEYGDLPQDYLEWAANLINNSTLEQMEYKDWLRAVYGNETGL